MAKTLNTKTVLGGLIVLLIVIGIAYYWKRPAKAPVVNDNGTSSTTPVGWEASTTQSGSYTVGEVSTSASSVKAPDFTRPLAISSSLELSAEVLGIMQKDFEANKAALTKDPKDFANWMQLGDLRKIGGDYAGAAADWEYMSAIYPKNQVSFDNLGDLYMNFLKDYPKAESNFKKAIANNAGDTNAYRNLFSLYADYGYKAGTSAAVDILTQGIKNNPKELDFYVLLARYYVKAGDSVHAKAQFDAAISVATAQGNADVAAQLRAEESSLK